LAPLLRLAQHRKVAVKERRDMLVMDMVADAVNDNFLANDFPGYRTVAFFVFIKQREWQKRKPSWEQDGL
jgi:hypothetical protein